jgi:hypothetical protein
MSYDPACDDLARHFLDGRPASESWLSDFEDIVMFSGGIGSWAAAKRVAERHGTDNLTLLFTDTLIEDGDSGWCGCFVEEAT